MVAEKEKTIIDIDKLVNVKRQSDGSWVCACAACRENGQDKTGNHLRVWPDGKFHCIVDPSKDHNRRLLQLVGTNADPNAAPIYTPKEPRVEISKTWDISILAGLIRNYDYWVNRGIAATSCEKFKIGVATKGQLANRTILPLIDKQNPNKVIGFTGRALNPNLKPKYRHLGEKGKWLFPADDIAIKKAKSIILVEGPADALYLDTHEIYNTLCLFGTNISSSIMGYLIKMNPERILIATNNEPNNNSIGLRAAEKIKKQLLQFFNPERVIIALPYKKDFADQSPEETLKYKRDYNL